MSEDDSGEPSVPREVAAKFWIAVRKRIPRDHDELNKAAASMMFGTLVEAWRTGIDAVGWLNRSDKTAMKARNEYGQDEKSIAV